MWHTYINMRIIIKIKLTPLRPDRMFVINVIIKYIMEWGIGSFRRHFGPLWLFFRPKISIFKSVHFKQTYFDYELRTPKAHFLKHK